MILPCFRLELSSIPSHIRLFLVLNVIIKKTKKQLIPHYCLLPVLKTLPLSRFNVTLGSEIVNYHDALDLKSFRFCFLLDVHRVFLENHVCLRSRRAAQKYRVKRCINIRKHRRPEPGSVRTALRDPFSHLCTAWHMGVPSTLRLFPSGCPLQQELLLLFVINIQQHWAVLYYFRGFSG